MGQRPTPTILIVVRTQPESSVNTLSVIQDIDQRICPTVVQAGVYVTLEDFEDTLHQVVGKNQQLFACTVNEYAGNRTDRKFDTRLRFSQLYGYPTKKDDISVVYDRVPDVYNLLSQHSILSVMKQCRTRLRYVFLIQSGM